VTYTLALRHHVEKSLRRDMKVQAVEADDDDDYGVACSGSIVWVRPMLDHEPPLLRVWTRAASGMKKSAALLREINDLNGGLEQVRCVLQGNNIAITAEVEIESIQPGLLGRLVHLVGGNATHIGELVTALHGGERPFALDGVPNDADHAS
jgi:hypothetical protein